MSGQPLAQCMQTQPERPQLTLQLRTARTECQMTENDLTECRPGVVGADFSIHEVMEVQSADEAVSGQGERTGWGEYQGTGP